MESGSIIQEAEYLPISALQHYLFCPRQCALIHIEQLWEENRLTAEGKLLHARVHEASSENRRDVRFAYGLLIHSKQLGLIGKADLVEFHHGPNGRWNPYPVEFKHGRIKVGDCDRIQLCAQAACLEEMLCLDVPEGAIFYKQTKKREIVRFDSSLKILLRETVLKLRTLITSTRTPPADSSSKCSACSINDYCLPSLPNKMNVVRRYLEQEILST